MKINKTSRAILLLLAAAMSGAVVMVVELLGARMLGVVYGGSLNVWAAMISVTLVSLAAGYFVGGWLADRWPKEQLLAVLLFVAALLLCGCPYARPVLLACYRRFGLETGAIASSVAIFLLPLGLMGMTGPFVIRLLSTQVGIERLGIIAGGVYAISTIGSVVGTLGTGLWLVVVFGTQAGFRIAAMVLAAVAVLLWIAGSGAKALVAVVLPFALRLVPVPATAVGSEYTTVGGAGIEILDELESLHGHITVLQKDDYKLLVVNGIVQTGIPLDLRKGRGLSDRYFQELLPYMVDDPAAAGVLIIGLAGGMTASMLMAYDMEVDSVDLDPRMIEVARKHFGFRGKAVVADGRRFLEDCSRHYDFCVIDTYSGDVFPFHLSTEEAFSAAKSVLKPGGVLALNYIGSPKGKPFACLYLTLGSVFKNLLAIRAEDTDDVQTITLFASDRPLTFSKRWLDNTLDFSGSTGPDPVTLDIQRLTVEPPETEGAFLLSDDHNPIDFYRSDEALRWRIRTAELIGAGDQSTFAL